MNIKTENKDMTYDELEFFDLMNSSRYNEAFELYDEKINKPINYFISSPLDDKKKQILIINPLFYFYNVKIDSELFKKLFEVFDSSLFNLDVNLQYLKNTNPLFFEKNSEYFFKFNNCSDPYSSIFENYHMYLNNPDFISRYKLTDLRDNLEKHYLFFEEKGLPFNSDGFESYLKKTYLRWKWSSESFKSFFDTLFKLVKSDDEKIWYRLYLKIHNYEYVHEGEYLEHCKPFKNKIKQKIKNFDFNNIPVGGSTFISILIDNKKYSEIYDFIKTEKISTVNLGNEILYMAKEFTSEKLQKSRDEIKKCIEIILEKGINTQGRFSSNQHTYKSEFTDALNDITNVAWISKKLEIKRRNEIKKIFDDNLPYQEARVIKQHIQIDKTEEYKIKKRL